MRPAFDRYYLGELAFLREMGKEFATKHPSVAGLLAERGADPDVERLLEGFAFLAARIRQRLDDAMPEVLEHYVSVLMPQALRTTPAATIVALKPRTGMLRGRTTIPRGTPIASRPVDGTPCLFRTTQDVDLLPITLASQRIDDLGSVAPALVLQLEISPGGAEALFREEGLRLHFHGEFAVASHVYLWARRHCARIVVSDESGASVVLPASSIVPVGFSDDESLVPWPTVANGAYRLLSEWMAFPSKFLFVDVRGLDAAKELTGSKITLRIEFERPPASPTRIPNDLVRLHCTPSVNLFEVTSDPVRGDGMARPSLIRASGIPPQHAEVFSVDSVVGLVSRTGERRPHPPFHEFEHAANAAKEIFYVVGREPSPIDDGIHVRIGLGTPHDVQAIPEEETLSLELTCTNRSLPQALRIGDVCVPTRSTPGSFTFENIGLVTRPHRPPLGDVLHDRLATHLVLHRRSFTEAASLRSLLAIHNVPEASDEPLHRSNRRKIQSIRSTNSSETVRIVRGAPVHGIALAIEVDESAFASLGEAFVFGEVVERALAELTPIHGFLKVTYVMYPSQTRIEWPARIGSRPML